MNLSQMQKTFEAPIVIGRARRTGKFWFQARARNLWCPRCSRTFPNGVYRNADGQRLCPYGDCSMTEAAARPWEAIRTRYRDYPEHPWCGVRYFDNTPASLTNSAALPASDA